MQIFFSYERTVRVLKWLTLALFAYVAVGLVVSVPGAQAIAEAMRPWAFIPAGATYKKWAMVPTTGADGRPLRRLEDTLWRRDTLRLMYPGAHHSIWLSWTGAGADRQLHCYYINLEEPFRRTPISLDTNDHTLDVVVEPDLTWRWKDEEEFATRTAQGVFSAEFAAFARTEAESVIARLEARQSPFCDGWESWHPDPAWACPTLPEGWDTLAATLWERRVWAYGEMAR